jgi:trigger factor
MTLKIESQPREDNQMQLIVEIEPELYEKYKHQAARKIARESKVPGFRPGKAPFDVVKRIFGEKAIDEQALDLLIDSTYPEIIKQADIKPSGPASIDKIESFDPLILNFVVPLIPIVELGDYGSIREEYIPATINPDEVDKFIHNLQQSYASVEPVERSIQESDLVSLSLTGKLSNPIEGEKEEIIKETPQQVIIQPEEQQKSDEWPFPGFTRLLIGLSANDEKTISHTYSDDAKDEKLRGKEVEFHLRLTTVKSMKLPELNDEFAQTVGEFDSTEALRKSVTERLEQNAKTEYDQTYFTKIIDKIHEHAILKYPPQVLNEEVEHVLDRLKQDLTRQKLDLETYLKMRNLDKDSFIEKEVKPAATRQLERYLIINEIAKLEKLELDPKDLEAEITETVKEMGNSSEFKKAKKSISQEKLANAVAMDAASRLLNRQTLNRLKDIATGNYDSITASHPPSEDEESIPPVAEEKGIEPPEEISTEQ